VQASLPDTAQEWSLHGVVLNDVVSECHTSTLVSAASGIRRHRYFLSSLEYALVRIIFWFIFLTFSHSHIPKRGHQRTPTVFLHLDMPRKSKSDTRLERRDRYQLVIY
jgi:hypothetical protein